jgi:hypothetical protein
MNKVKFVLLLFFLTYCFASFSQQRTIGLTKYREGNLKSGYILFAPLECKTTYLIDKCGRLIHSWKSNYDPGLSAYLLPNGHLLRTGITKDSFFSQSANGGIIELLDWKSNVLWSYTLSNDTMAQHHDIFPMDNGHILVIARVVIPENKALAYGRKPGTLGGNFLFSERILEIKPIGKDQAEIVWQWNVWDHLIQDDSPEKPNFGIISEHPERMNINFAPKKSADWIHFNSVSYNKDLDQIILSGHNISELWIIDHSTSSEEAATHSGGKYGKGGDILYRWGNPASYNGGTKMDQALFSQHNAHWIPKNFKDGGDIMVFNNGLGRMPIFSSVEIIRPPTLSPGVYLNSLPFGPSQPNWTYKDSIPESFFSGFKSGASRLPNGNTLICLGLSGKFIEVGDNNTIVWEYINPVAPNDKILKNGESGSSVVFKCLYYPKNFSGFKRKNVKPKGYIETNVTPFKTGCKN